MDTLIKNWRNYKQNIINEGGFSRIRQIMLGQVPTIDQVGILTAENPDGLPATSQENKQSMRRLKGILASMKAGYTDIDGSFGSPEKSVFIMNISRDDVTRLGQEFGQEAVIWGQKMRDDDDNPYFRFEYIEGQDTIQTRDVSLGGQEIEDRPDFYSQKGSRKFVIPFFDDDHGGSKPAEGGRRISFAESELPEDGSAARLVESIKKRNSFLFQQDRTEKSKWHHRNIMKTEMEKLSRLTEK